MSSVQISIKVPFFQTEEKGKLLKCVENLLDLKIELNEIEDEEGVFLYNDNIPIDSLKKFFFYLRQTEILDTVRRCADVDLNQKTITFHFHKQALFNNKIAVITPDTSSPLGSIELTIKSSNPNEVLNWITPQTFQGKELKKRKFGEIYHL
ncbi:MAG: hypothetical protein ACTSSG_04670 [Candidatus Heimdallarchaeaceae archaeon]